MNDTEPGRDDELRRRLHDIPSASARLDPEAIIAGAKRRRRPKTIALSSAATVAGVLIVAPLVVPGLSILSGTTGASMTSDSGAEPESAQEPAEQPEPGADGPSDPDLQNGGAGTDEAEDAGEGDTGASGDQGASGPGIDSAVLAAACSPAAAGDAGLALRFLDDPSDGTADLAVENVTGALISVRLEDVGSVEFDDDGRVVAAGVWPGFWSRSELAAGAGGYGGVTVDLEPRVPCADPAGAAAAGTGPGIAPVATVLVTRDGEYDPSPLTVVGVPWE